MNDTSKCSPDGLPNRRSIRLKGYDYSQAGSYFITICCQDRICRFGNVVDGKMILNEYGQVAHEQWMKLPERFANMAMDVFQIMPNHMHGIIALKNPEGAGFTPAQNIGQPNHPNGLPNNPIEQPDHPNGLTDHHIGQPDHPNGLTNHPMGQTDHPKGLRNHPIGQPDNTTGLPNHPMGQTNNRATARVAPAVSEIVGAYKSLVANGCLTLYKSKNETMDKLWQRNYYERIIRNEWAYMNISEYIINNPSKWAADTFFLKRNSPKHRWKKPSWR
jgi:REP element-mobilizing transposase RayT